MTRRMATVAACAAGLAVCAGMGAQAQPSQKDDGKSCFYSRDIFSWTAVDRATVNLRVRVNDYYQLKLLGDCPNLDYPGLMNIGLEHRGTNWICSGLDATLIVPQPGSGIPPLRCPVSTVRKLSPAEVAALPSKDKP